MAVATHVTTAGGERIYVKAADANQLKKKVRQTKIKYGVQTDVSDCATFREYCDTWLEVYKIPTIRPSSLSSLQNTLNTHVLPFFGEMYLTDIKAIHIQRFMNSLKGKSKSLQTKCLGAVRAILRSAVDDGLLDKSPVRSDLKAQGTTKKKEALTQEQAQKLLDAVSGTRAYTFCLIALTTGMRRGEIVGLMWADIDFKKRVIHVQHNKSYPPDKEDAPVTNLMKTEAGRRDIPMAQILYDHLSVLHKHSGSEFVLAMESGKSLTKSSYRALWSIVTNRTAGPRKLGDKYGPMYVSLDFHITPHMLRHTFITQLFESGLDVKQVQYLAGHANPTITMSIYTHYREESRAEETQEQLCDAMGYLS